MELSLKIDTEKKTDRALFATLGLLMHSYSKTLESIEKDLAEEEEREEKESEEKTAEPEVKQEEPTEEKVEEPAPEKPKRTRKKKVEPEPVAEEPVVEENPADESGELPFDKEVVEPAQEEPVKEEEAEKKLAWTDFIEILKNKKKELGIDNASPRKDEFNEFVRGLSAEYGDERPSKLTDEARYNFKREKFDNIAIDGEGKFYVKPF